MPPNMPLSDMLARSAKLREKPYKLSVDSLLRELDHLRRL